MSKEGIQTIISTYFQELFRSTKLSAGAIAKVLEGMTAKVSTEMNEVVSQPFSAEEVKHAIFQMYPYKSPGPDGLSPVFYHKYWHIVRPEVTSFVLDFLNLEEALSCVGRVLRELEAASGLAVNLEKSAIAFSRNIPKESQIYLARTLGVRTVERHEKYLGLPALVGRYKKETFQNLKDKVWKRLQSWRCKNLLQAGKVVLLKSVVQAMPTYVMGCFLVPTSIHRELEGLMADLLSPRDVIVAGPRWHIGSGQKVFIWTDREVFRLEDVEAILRITSVAGEQDQLRWHYEKSGKYSVKSAYLLLSKAPFVSTGSMSLTSDNWNFIWPATVPPKVRLFAWRACRNSLPTSANLARRASLSLGAILGAALTTKICSILFSGVNSPASSGLFPISPGLAFGAITPIQMPGLGVCFETWMKMGLLECFSSAGSCGAHATSCCLRTLLCPLWSRWSEFGAVSVCCHRGKVVGR
ncbi:UNVERIFIED_CONTAM: hypothetical protein Sradi_3569400 [Sesamum radiatum]|uniref:Reverse transcriptase zinc-binding domain-containing protein n=1 Tax=Sesamum radiatum TaxID=300843 RepID=A0AAW2QG79_SESRA